MALRSAIALICLSLTFTAPAAAQGGLPNREQSVALLNVIALKGGECSLLRPWEAATVQALADQDTLGWAQSRLEAAAAETQALLARTACDEPFLNVWIEGARRGLEAEYLSMHLVVYRALASMQTPPEAFRDAAGRTNPEADIATIDEKLAAIEASGARPEGGGSWADYIASTSAAIERFAPMLDRGEAPAEVAFVIPRAIAIAELWLADDDPDAAAP